VTDFLIVIASFTALALAVHHFTKHELHNTQLPHSRSQALKDLLSKSNFNATHRYNTSTTEAESDLERARRG